MLQQLGTVLPDVDQLVPLVHDVGRRHAGYGVRKEHYLTVRLALFWALQQGLGTDFTPTVEQAWSEIYSLIAKTMQSAAPDDQI
jgi:hemoglobin-like flavoprotein